MRRVTDLCEFLAVVDEHCNENNSSRWLSHSHRLAKQVHFRLDKGCCVRRLLLAAKIAYGTCVCAETRGRSEPLSGQIVLRVQCRHTITIAAVSSWQYCSRRRRHCCFSS